jgi:hypothetical protein
MHTGNSTVRGREFGDGLRATMNQAGLGGREAAAVLDCDPSKISTLVNGKGGANQVELALLLGLCRTPADERRHLQSLFPDTGEADWLQQHGKCRPIVNRTFSANLGAAKKLVGWHPYMMPDLLQTAAYARAVLRASPSVPEGELEARVKAHLNTQKQLYRGLTSTFYLHEFALCLRVDTPETHAEQAQHLLNMATRPNTTIRILPAAAGAHAGLRGPFTLLSFPKYQSAVWLEHENSSTILENSDAVAAYDEIVESLNAASLSADESKETIRKVMCANEELAIDGGGVP